MSLSIPTSIAIPMQLSFSKTLTSHNPFLLSLQPPKPISIPRKTTVIRMGGGPRTYPGGVSKWQWKRMQAKKAKQLLKARLCRERQIYEMRKRAELKAAVSELERPWEVVERAPNLFSVKADEQVKVLADRFQKPGGFDLWSENDGPQLFQSPDGLPTARFFPKGVVHSVRPYGLIHGEGGGVGTDGSVGEEEDEFLKDRDELRDGLESDSEDMGDFDGENRRNGGEMRENWSNVFRSLDRKQKENDDRYMQRSETRITRSGSDGRINRIGGFSTYSLDSGDGETRTSRNRNGDRVSRTGGSSSSRYVVSRDRALRQHGEARTKSKYDDRNSRSGGLRNYRYNEYGDGSLMLSSESRTSRSGNDGRISSFRSHSGDGETRISRNRNDDRVSRIGGSSSSRDRALRQHGEARTKGRNDDRISRSGGLRNSRSNEYGDGSLMQAFETRTNRSGNDGRSNRIGSLRSPRYSSDSGDGETRTSRSRNDDGVTRTGGSSSSRYYESRDRALRQHGEARTRGKNDGRRISRSGGLRNSRYSSESEAYDMSLQQDGSYGLRERNKSYGSSSGADI